MGDPVEGVAGIVIPGIALSAMARERSEKPSLFHSGIQVESAPKQARLMNTVRGRISIMVGE